MSLLQDSTIDINSLTNYNPTITVNETSNQVYKTHARTIVCSNIKNELWSKSVYPIKQNPLEIKTIGNKIEFV